MKTFLDESEHFEIADPKNGSQSTEQEQTLVKRLSEEQTIGRNSKRKLRQLSSLPKDGIYEKTLDNLSKSAVLDSAHHTIFTNLVQKLEREDLAGPHDFFTFQPVIEDSPCHMRAYLPPLSPRSQNKFTLVLDLDETLVHFEENQERTGGQFHVRPFAVDFLKQMSKYYELVIFTAAIKEYADWILDKIDEEGVISHRLYREHTCQKNNVFLKDLTLLGRDIRKCIIVDNNAENFQIHPQNGIFIKSWYGDPTDQALKRLAPILRGTSLLTLEISAASPNDIRQALAHVKQATCFRAPLRD